MDISDSNFGEVARDFLARRGIDPDDAPEPEPFSLADHLTASTNATLDLMLPPRFRQTEPDHPRVRQWIADYLRNPQTCPGLVLKGPVGSGKTHTALGALRVIALGTARRGRRITYLATTHPDFNRAMRPQPDDGHNRTLEDMQTVDLLVFDDLGAGKLTDWGDDTLHRLIDTRWAYNRATIVTTNLTSKEFGEAIDERVVSRLSTCVQVPLVDGDRRRGGAR